MRYGDLTLIIRLQKGRIENRFSLIIGAKVHIIYHSTKEKTGFFIF